MKTPALILTLCIFISTLATAEDSRVVIGGLDGVSARDARPHCTVLLALAGGGIRGLASIGVLKAFEEKGIGIGGIAGTSMGGIVGGLYAAGYSPDQLQTIAGELDFAALFQNAPPRTTMLQTRRRERGRDLLTIRFDGLQPQIPQGLTSAQYLTNYLTLLATRATYHSSGDFSRLRVPFATVSTDVVSGEAVALRGGSLSDAMRATMAFPLAFTGFDIDGRLLMDGGMVDPVPVSLARELSDTVDFVVAVNTASPLFPRDQIVTPLDIVDQVTTIMTADRLRFSLERADYVIAPVPESIRSTDFRFRDSLIALGYRAGLSAADSILALCRARHGRVSLRVAGVTCDSGLADCLPAFTAALGEGGATRSSLFAKLQGVAREHGLFELRADLSTGTADSTAAAPCSIHLSGFKCFPPGAVAFRVVGNSQYGDGELLNALALGDSVITAESLRRGIDRMLDLYHAKGWDLAHARQVIVEPDRRFITIVLDEAVIADIEVDGVERTRPWYVRAHFPLKSGEPYSTARAAQGLKNIYGTDLFDRVTVDLVPIEDRPTVKIRVEEKAYYQVRLGWHWDDEYESEEFIELADDNLGGIGVEGLAHARYSPDRQDYHLQFKADRIFQTYLTSRIGVYHTVLNRHVYVDADSLLGKRSERKVGFEARLGQQIARLGTVSAALIVEEVEYEWDSVGAPVERLGLRILELESLVETFDRMPFPNSGKKHYFELQQAGKLIGGEIEYTRFFTSVEAYFPMGPYFTYHPKIAVGLSRPDLPWSEKFYLGGMDSFAGYRTHQLAGDKLFVVSQEMRVTLPLRLYFSVRYDIGDVYKSSAEVKLATLLHSAGVSLALDSPIGPFEIGYGVADDSDRFYLRAGFEF